MRPVQIPCRFFRQVIDPAYLCRTRIDDIKILCCLFIYIYGIFVILGEGTEAASEVVSNPAYLDAMLQKAPKNWDQLNLEAVIVANVIEGHPGPPTVVAVETW